ncbi:MAG: hypothetical protein OEZ58_22570 [Gammaproteobacteria bacterium]|nr:hypothetical protein [Gammaproteobacteria bacterium]
MLLLPSGTIVDITTDRAKYHALRQSWLGVHSNSSHSELYALVDVIYRLRDSDGEIKRGSTEFDFVYAGETVASIDTNSNWSEVERRLFFKWLTEETQVKRIENCRRRLEDHQHTLSSKTHQASKRFYSLLEQRLSSHKLRRAAASQWLATINNFSKTGLRQDEFYWSGLQGLLKSCDANAIIAKEVLLECIEKNKIRLELSTELCFDEHGGLSFVETAKPMPHQAVYRAALKLDSQCICVMRYQDSAANYRIGLVKTLNSHHTMALNQFWFALDPWGRAIINPQISSTQYSRFFSCSESAKQHASLHAREYLGLRQGVRPNTYYDHMTLVGGEHYREWKLSLPHHQRSFFGAHYFDHNVLAHIRTTIRHDTQGKKILFIEEVQSDWHQSGKRYGYDNNPWGSVAHAPFAKEWVMLAVKQILIQAKNMGLQGIAWTPGAIQEKRYHRSLDRIRSIYDHDIPQGLNRLGKRFGLNVKYTTIATRDPWLTLHKQQDKWRVACGEGKFQTRAKYSSREQAMAVIYRHSRCIDLDIPVFYFNHSLRQQIRDRGLPLFGETWD